MADEQAAPEIRTDVPHSARIWNYWMGGKENYAIDRVAGDAAIAVYPDITRMASESRRFLTRAVRHLAGEAGIRQFLDMGTGLPSDQNTHEAAHSVAPESKIVYVDNDPLVLVHARALLTGATDQGAIDYLDADITKPEAVIERAHATLDFTEPIAVMLMGVLGHVENYDDVVRIISTTMDAVPSGSYLVAYEGTTDDEGYVRLCEEYARTGGAPYLPRHRDQIKAYFNGLELVDPGFVSLTEWRPEGGDVSPIGAYCAVARKP